MKDLYLLLKNISILYVEDEKQTREEMASFLKELTSFLFVASSGEEALKIYHKKRPHIIISDINMPKLNGIEFIKQIRAKDLKTPIILLTAYNDVEYLLPAANLNIQSYIIKPITKLKIQQVLKDAINILEMNNSLYIRLNEELDYDKTSSEVIHQKIEKEKLNKKEKELLNLLLDNSNRVVSYEEIEGKIWIQNDEVMTSMALRTVVKNLRKKTSTRLIKNVSGHGYKIILS